MIIAAIDPGVKNLAISVENIDTDSFSTLVKKKDISTALLCAETLYSYVHDITDVDTIDGVTNILITYSWIWEMCDVILIERQIQFKGVVNNTCLRVSHHCMSFFYFFYPSLIVKDYPSSNKTRVLSAPKGMSKRQRKQWSTDVVTQLFIDRGDTSSTQYLEYTKSNGQKLDDICDCVLMCLTYAIVTSR